MRLYLVTSLLFILFSCSQEAAKTTEKPKPEEKTLKLIRPLDKDSRNKGFAEVLEKIKKSGDKFTRYYYQGLKNGRSATNTIQVMMFDHKFLNFWVEGEGYEKWEVLSKIKPFTKTIEYEAPMDIHNFDHVNPDFVEWFAENMIPKAGERIGKQTAQAIYSEIGYPIFRNLVVSHDYLEKIGFDQAVDDYKNKVAELDHTDLDPELITYLYETYTIHLAEEPLPEQYYASSCFAGGTACGFWIRRRIDGSEKNIWNLVERVVQEYDPGFEDYRANYKHIYPTD